MGTVTVRSTSGVPSARFSPAWNAAANSTPKDTESSAEARVRPLDHPGDGAGHERAGAPVDEERTQRGVEAVPAVGERGPWDPHGARPRRGAWRGHAADPAKAADARGARRSAAPRGVGRGAAREGRSARRRDPRGGRRPRSSRAFRAAPLIAPPRPLGDEALLSVTSAKARRSARGVPHPTSETGDSSPSGTTRGAARRSTPGEA